MSTQPDPRISAAAIEFLSGGHSVLEFTHAFRAAMNSVVSGRPLDGAEVDLFYALEAWETAGWQDRPDVVDRLRAACRRLTEVG